MEAATGSTGRASRSYRSAARAEQARRTRTRIVQAASASFVRTGYAGTTMRSVATDAGVAVATVELAFGTKSALLKAAIDVAIAGDDASVPMLERSWADAARAATTPEAFLAVVTGVITPAQERSAGLVLAAFQASTTDPDLAALTEQLVRQREVTAGWLVDRITGLADLRPELSRRDAVDSVWLLMDPAVFVRLTRHRRWSPERYRIWLGRSLRTLLLPDPPGLDPVVRPDPATPAEGAP